MSQKFFDTISRKEWLLPEALEDPRVIIIGSLNDDGNAAQSSNSGKRKYSFPTHVYFFHQLRLGLLIYMNATGVDYWVFGGKLPYAVTKANADDKGFRRSDPGTSFGN